MITITGLDKLLEGMKHLTYNVSKISNIKDEKIVDNSKKVKGDRKVSNKTKIAKTPEEARRFARLKNAQLDIPMNESQTPHKEKLEAVDLLAQDFVSSIIGDILKEGL